MTTAMTAAPAPERLGLTPSQTVGPYLHLAFSWTSERDLAPAGVPGERVTIELRLFDHDGLPLKDGMIEFWQANAGGRYAHPEDSQAKPLDEGFHGFGRASTDENGRVLFHTVKPGAVPGPGNSLQAPHINVSVLGRGLLNRLMTRVYFPGDPLNGNDPVLGLVPAAHRATLIAVPAEAGGGAYRFDIHLGGDNETTFFAV
jgi:protocatechuate 3,4-dioxygenase, alpha subunit